MALAWTKKQGFPVYFLCNVIQIKATTVLSISNRSTGVFAHLTYGTFHRFTLMNHEYKYTKYSFCGEY
jgi:hypothetical protein